jgi:isopentenyl-diphosphate delta-isomerase
MPQNNKIVSFDNEPLILVDEDDNILGYKAKAECHEGKGILHRAFSVFIFNRKQELLIQQRSAQKLLWPLYWSNSCCSHPRKGEITDAAALRRVQEELGITTQLEYLYKFKYHAVFQDLGAESELCSVYIGISDDKIDVNPNEIAHWNFVEQDQIAVDMKKNQDVYTPWFKMEWLKLRQEYSERIRALFQ